MSFYWPILLVAGSNIIYHICAKATPSDLDPLASLLVTYSMGSIFGVLLYYITVPDANIIREFTHLNWAPFVLGFAIVGLEAGNIYMYKVGWSMNTGYIVQSAILAVALVIAGYLLYHEQLTTNKIIGLIICFIGLYFINK